jgi:hypothetical protein
VDQLGAHMLSPYGQTMIETPNLNQIAAESILLENAYSDSPDLLIALRSLWYPTHAAITRGGGEVDFSDHLASQLASQGVQSILLTDDADVAQHEIAAGFDRIIEIESEPIDDSATTAEDTWLAGFFAQSVEVMRSLEPGCLLWIQCRGLKGPWDAPYEMRQRLADTEDPDPPEFVDPPRKWFDVQFDSPDIQLGYQQACAAQVLLLDEFLGVMFEILKRRNHETLFSLLSTRGFPLGEHGFVGTPESLHDESIHVPWMVRWPDLRYRASRIQNMVQPNSIYYLLQNWFDDQWHSIEPFTTRVLPDKTSEAVCSVWQDQESIQTHAWKLIRDRSEEADPAIRLYKKPDDRWEVNDVRDRCPQVVLALETLLDHCLDLLQSRQPETLREGLIRLKISDELAFDM